MVVSLVLLNSVTRVAGSVGTLLQPPPRVPSADVCPPSCWIARHRDPCSGPVRECLRAGVRYKSVSKISSTAALYGISLKETPASPTSAVPSPRIVRLFLSVIRSRKPGIRCSVDIETRYRPHNCIDPNSGAVTAVGAMTGVGIRLSRKYFKPERIVPIVAQTVRVKAAKGSV